MKSIIKTLTLILVLALSFSFIACDENEDANTDNYTGYAFEYEIETDDDDNEYVLITGLFVADGTATAVANGDYSPVHLEIGKDNKISVPVYEKDDNGEETSIAALVYPEATQFEGKTTEEIKAEIEALVVAINKKLPSFKHINTVELRDTEFEKNTSRKILRYKVK